MDYRVGGFGLVQATHACPASPSPPASFSFRFAFCYISLFLEPLASLGWDLLRCLSSHLVTMAEYPTFGLLDPNRHHLIPRILQSRSLTN